ncbi:MAG: hypothetical protein HKP40_12780, partial [Litoreibacter sp.]|nr:hypothetical protein [Litoreibacter sp.]
MATSRKKPSQAKKTAPKTGSRAAKSKPAAASRSKAKTKAEDLQQDAPEATEAAPETAEVPTVDAQSEADPPKDAAVDTDVDTGEPPAEQDGDAAADDAPLELGADDRAESAADEKDDISPSADKTEATSSPVDNGVASEAVETVPSAAEAAPPRRSGFAGLVLGGIVAALIGFGTAQFLVPEGWPRKDSAPAVDYQGMIDAQAERLASLEAQLSEAAQKAQAAEEKAAAAEQEAAARIDSLEADLEAAKLAPEPVDLSPEVQAALEAQKGQIAALSSELEEMTAFAKSQIEAAAEQVEDVKSAEARAKARGALGVVRAALDSGSPFEDVLPDISAAAEIPAPLAETAQSGVPTLIELQDSFPEVARRALSVSLRETSGDSTSDRLKLFLQDQIGVRSLAPREGDDPDAV